MEKLLKLDQNQDAYIEYSVKNNHFIVLSTYVNESLRGQGIAQKLYQKFVSLVKENGGTFSSKCSYVTTAASRDEMVTKIYKKNT